MKYLYCLVVCISLFSASFAYAQDQTRSLSADEAYVEAIRLRQQGKLLESELLFRAILGAKVDMLLSLEIARIYYEEANRRKALKTFKQIKKDFDLPPVVLGRVNSYIRELELTRGKFSYYASHLNEENLSKQPTKAGEYYLPLFGATLNYTPDIQRHWGWYHSLGLSNRISPIWLLNSRASITDYEGIDYDSSSLSFTLDNTLAPQRRFVEFSTQLSERYGGAKTKYVTYGAKLGYEIGLQKSAIIPSIGYYILENNNNYDYRGYRKTADLSIINPLTVKNTRLSYSWQWNEYNSSFNSTRTRSVSLRKSFPSPVGTFALSASQSKTDHEEIDPFWQLRRGDINSSRGAEYCPRLWKVGEVVCITWSKNRRDSNIRFYDDFEEAVYSGYIRFSF
ncbi:MAG: hypothetical protein K0U39_07950 [Alphaproteobacteria bacterium]|nr:hypothetical protein [Alphaproteobacteria bacterium]